MLPAELAKNSDVRQKRQRNYIRQWVLRERKRRNITNLIGPVREMSCFAHGEFRNLVERQLILTPEEGPNPALHRTSFNHWNELLKPEILQGAFQYIKNEKKWERTHRD